MKDLPIPPNCKYFRQPHMDSEVYIFEIVDPEEGVEIGIYLDEVPEHWRPIIANVAEVAWLKKAEENNDISTVYGCDREPERKAEENARTCRARGEEATKA